MKTDSIFYQIFLNYPRSFFDLIGQIIVYKFPQKSREDIEAMFELSDLKKTRVYQEAFTEGEAKIVLRQLSRRFGEIHSSLTEQIQRLSIEQLEDLAEALLDFESEDDLVTWLNR